ncbi:MAG: PsiF family protein [Paenacidovorax caeni]
MATCATPRQATKGDERKALMKQCWAPPLAPTKRAAPYPPPATNSSRSKKMKPATPRPKPRLLKGDERKAFMKECLSNKG